MSRINYSQSMLRAMAKDKAAKQAKSVCAPSDGWSYDNSMSLSTKTVEVRVDKGSDPYADLRDCMW
jgi:hypothetical protein